MLHDPPCIRCVAQRGQRRTSSLTRLTPQMTEFVLRYDEKPVMDAVTPASLSLLVAQAMGHLRATACFDMYLHVSLRDAVRAGSAGSQQHKSHSQKPKICT